MKKCSFVLFLIFLIAAAKSADARDSKLFLLAVGDASDEKIGSCVQDGLNWFSSLFVENLPNERLVLYNRAAENDETTWTGPDFAESVRFRNDLLEAIESCPAQADDAILIYWFGYSSWNKNECRLFRSCDAPEDQIARNEIILALKAKKVRMSGLITDSGANFKTFDANKLSLDVSRTERITPLLNCLFFQSRGLLDVNSAGRRQSPLVMNVYGSAFVESFGELVEKYDFKIMNWNEIVKQTDRLASKNFKGIRQKIDVFSLPKEETSSDDAEFQQKRRQNSTLQDVESFDWDQYSADYRSRANERTAEPYPENFAATSPWPSGGFWSAPLYYPEAGDLLLGINGKQIFCYDDFINEIQRSPSVIYLTLVDRRRGHLYEMRTFLGSPQGSRLRLGLSVVNVPFGGVQITGTLAGSPASRCQYRLGFGFDYHIPVPIGLEPDEELAE